MAINLSAFVPFAKGLGAARKGQMQGEDERFQREQAERVALFNEYARRRQLDQTDRTIGQREELQSERLQNDIERRRMQDEAANLRAQINAGMREKTTGMQVEGRERVAGMQYGPDGSVDRTNTSRQGMNSADNQTALEIARIRAQMMQDRANQQAPGKVDDRRAKAEERLSGAWGREQTVKNATEISSRLSQMKAAGDGPAGDLSLIFGYMKILDPTSVVREGEQASASNARGVPDMVRNIHNKILKGDKLTPAQRAQFRDEATKLAQAQQRSMDPIKRRFGALARNYGADSATVVSDPYETVLDTPGTITLEQALEQMRARKKP